MNTLGCRVGVSDPQCCKVLEQPSHRSVDERGGFCPFHSPEDHTFSLLCKQSHPAVSTHPLRCCPHLSSTILTPQVSNGTEDSHPDLTYSLAQSLYRVDLEAVKYLRFERDLCLGCSWGLAPLFPCGTYKPHQQEGKNTNSQPDKFTRRFRSHHHCLWWQENVPRNTGMVCTHPQELCSNSLYLLTRLDHGINTVLALLWSCHFAGSQLSL